MSVPYYITPVSEEKILFERCFKCMISLTLTIELEWNMAVEYAPRLEMDMFLCDTVKLCKFIKYSLI